MAILFLNVHRETSREETNEISRLATFLLVKLSIECVERFKTIAAEL